ncbi:MAG: Rrf2 family transcriptional regulator [Candidatus Omnitrophica bacterium]|nr:HTH-type transcriptional repressor NsrR [bacterium]NUN97226.1 Rrf2 family transcriptional regulator [Candidatus Omnitrophota bacterium]
MQLTLRADYSLRVLLYLAVHPGRLVPTSEIAAAYGISNNHLVKVVLLLSHEGYIRSHRGRLGGNELALDPEAINLGEVLRRVEPDFKVVECFDEGTNTCPILPVCGLKVALAKAVEAFLQVVDRYTLADVTRPETRPALAAHFLPLPNGPGHHHVTHMAAK